MANFREALTRARALARQRQRTRAKDPEALFALTLAAGMESDALAILEKKQLDGLKRMKEANECAKQLLAQRPEAADAYVAPGIANYIIWLAEPWLPIRPVVRRDHGDKKLGMQEVAKDRRKWPLSSPFCENHAGLGGSPRKQNVLAQNYCAN